MKTLPNITFKQLYYFDKLAGSTSFGAAAEQVHISQPAMSLQIKALEETFGGQLIERNVKGIVLTPLGVQVREQANEILVKLEGLSTLAIDAHERPAGLVRLGLIPTVAPYLLPKAFPALKAAFDDVSFAIREGRTASCWMIWARTALI